MQSAVNLHKALMCHCAVERKSCEVDFRQRVEAERLTDEREGKVYLETLFLSFKAELVSKYLSLITSYSACCGNGKLKC